MIHNLNQWHFINLPVRNQIALYAYRVFTEHDHGHLPEDRGGCLNKVEARGLGGNPHLFFDQVQLHQILESRGMEGRDERRDDGRNGKRDERRQLQYVNIDSSGKNYSRNVLHNIQDRQLL